MHILAYINLRLFSEGFGRILALLHTILAFGELLFEILNGRSIKQDVLLVLPMTFLSTLLFSFL